MSRQGLWRFMLLLLAGSACAAMAAWWRSQPPPAPTWANGVAGLGLLASAACAVGLWRMPRLVLHWDRQSWWLARDGAAEQAGELALAIDLGGWMLLRFVPSGATSGASRRRRSIWFAVQRRGLEGQWHALRCALYCARAEPPSGADTA